MELVRQYKNAAGDDLRVDSILLQGQRKGNTIASKAQTHTFARNLTIRPVYNNTVADREIAEIEIIGDFSTIDTVDFTWAKWESPAATLDMSDLPKVGDTI